jgi:hypothetical protein
MQAGSRTQAFWPFGIFYTKDAKQVPESEGSCVVNLTKLNVCHLITHVIFDKLEHTNTQIKTEHSHNFITLN